MSTSDTMISLLRAGTLGNLLPHPKQPGEWTLYHVADAYDREIDRRNKDSAIVSAVAAVPITIAVVVYLFSLPEAFAGPHVQDFLAVTITLLFAAIGCVVLGGVLRLSFTHFPILSAVKQLRLYAGQLRTGYDEVMSLVRYLGVEDVYYFSQVERSEFRIKAHEVAAQLYASWKQGRDDPDSETQLAADKSRVSLAELHDLLVRFDLAPPSGYQDYRSLAGQLAKEAAEAEAA